MVDIQHYSDFTNALPEKWRSFIEQHAATFDQTLPWFVEFERHLLAPGQRLHILTVSDADSGPLALMPLRTDRVALAGPLTAAAVCSLSNYYTALFAPVVVPGRDGEIAQALVRGILELPADKSIIDLNPVASDAALITEMCVELARRGYDVERYFRFGNWYLEVGGRGSREYFATLPGQVKSTIERKGKKLRARPDTRIRVITEVAHVPAGMDAYEAVYRSSWKSDEPHKDFIRAVCTEFARRGWLRLGLIEIGDRPAAAQIWFCYRGTASIFKLAYDAEFTNLSVGTALTTALMQHALDIDKVAIVDYLCGDDPYKRDWMSARRERVGVRASRRWTLATLISYAAHLKRRIRKPAPTGLPIG